MDAMQSQGWLDVTVNSELMQKKFGTHLFPINSYTVVNAFPQIMQMFGIEEELDISLSMDKPNVTFGPKQGTDIRLDCVIKMGIKRHGSLNYLVYDEFIVSSEFNIEINSEVLFANFATLDVSPTDPARTKPIFTTL